MAFAGNSLLALNLFAFISYTLGTMASTEGSIPSMKEIAEHVNVAFNSLLKNYIDTKTYSIPCEISISGHCPVI